MNETASQEEITEQLRKILQERGKEGLELARKTILDEKIDSKEVREALDYFMNEYWHDFTSSALLSLFCEAAGGDPEITTPVAASLTLISGAIDIHDDIIDQSKNKDKRPTVYGKFGKEIALLVGDALLFKGFTVLYDAAEKGISAKKIAAITNIINKAFFELGNAEALELQFRGRTDVTPEEYLQVVRKKGADLEGYARISAILGGASEEEIDALGECGRLLGMLIILRDDMIDMLDTEETIHRIQKEHINIAILYALQNPEINPEIRLILKKPITPKNAKKLAALVDKAGGFAQINAYMNKLANDASVRAEKVKCNQKYLTLLIHGMLLPNWQKYLSPSKPNR
jgi:geranylgeranyl diphosphate synthase type I